MHIRLLIVVKLLLPSKNNEMGDLFYNKGGGGVVGNRSKQRVSPSFVYCILIDMQLFLHICSK